MHPSFLKSSTSVGLFFCPQICGDAAPAQFMWDLTGDGMKNQELVERFTTAYNNFDIEECSKYLHPEIKLRSLVSQDYSLDGIEKFKESYGATFRNFPAQKTILKSRLVFDDTIIDEEMLYGRPERPEGYHGYVIYAFRDGLIDRIWI
jgi:hypothetical protein